MATIKVFIHGVPYSRNKNTGNIEAPKEWTQKIVSETKNLPKIKKSCKIKVTYYLPPSKRPKDHPHGSDLDNLNKRLFDAMNNTIFSEAPGKDGCIKELIARKVSVDSESEAGVDLVIEGT